MLTFKIASLFIKAEKLPDKFDNFRTEEQPSENSILIIRQVNKEHSVVGAKKLVELQQFDIWKSDEYENAWIYRLKVGAGTLLVSGDYSYAEYYTKDIVAKDKVLEFLEPTFQMAIQCRLLKEGFIVFHAACVAVKEVAYAFSGDSGVGKSTRANKWVRDYSAEWISGDRPIVDPMNGLVYGAPWDGKEHIYRNSCKKLGAIFQVNRSQQTCLKEMTYMERYSFSAAQMFVPMWDKNLTGQVFASLKQMISKVPMYSLYCDQTSEAMKEVYQSVCTED